MFNPFPKPKMNSSIFMSAFMLKGFFLMVNKGSARFKDRFTLGRSAIQRLCIPPSPEEKLFNIKMMEAYNDKCLEYTL